MFLLLSELLTFISQEKWFPGDIYFEYVSVYDSYFIHRYIIIEYRSSSIKDKIQQL